MDAIKGWVQNVPALPVKLVAPEDYDYNPEHSEVCVANIAEHLEDNSDSTSNISNPKDNSDIT